jgi:hypothetical protein
MTIDAFKKGIEEMYQGEIIGEVALNGMLPLFTEAERQYKLATILQLETETKARLRPTLLRLGIELGEQEASRNAGQQMADAMRGKTWQEAMATLRDGVEPYVRRYQEILESTPSEYRDIAESMVVHEQSIVDFAVLELDGHGERSVKSIEAQLKFKLPRP